MMSVSRSVSNGRAALAFVLCLVAGLGLVTWRAKARLDASRAIALTEAQAISSSIQLQLGQVASIAETLGSLAKQGRVTPANFQGIASSLLAGCPGLGSLELEPHGVVADVVPRAGHERALGVNVLKDPAQRTNANEAFSRRALTVSAPVLLDDGQSGIIARVPIFERTPEGRESFWGFVAVTMRVKELLARTKVEELWRQGYNYALFRAPSGSQKGLIISSHGLSTLQDTVQQFVRVQNLDLALALKPRDGWVNVTKIVVESLAFVLMSAVIAISVSILESRRALEAALEDATQRHAREGQAQKAEQAVFQKQIAAKQAEVETAQVALSQAERRAEELRMKLSATEEAGEKAALAHHAELKDGHEALKNALETIAQLRSQLESAAHAEKKSTKTAQERLENAEAAAAALKARLEAAERSAQEAAQANAAKLERVEQANRSLKEQLAWAEQVQARVAKLEALLQAAEEELKHHQQDTPKALGEPDNAVSLPKAEIEKGPSAVDVPTEDSPARRPKASRGRKTRADDQLNLFGTEAPAISPPAEPSADSETEMPDEATLETSTTLAPSTPLPEEPPRREALQEESEPPSQKPLPKPDRDEPEEEAIPGPRAQAQERTPRPLAAPPVEPAQLRKACNQILPLLTDQDPGAKDCLKDNRKTFRSAFAPEAYLQFEEQVRKGDFQDALENLKKAARKHGILL